MTVTLKSPAKERLQILFLLIQMEKHLAHLWTLLSHLLSPFTLAY
jgi:hypothetical protein